MSRRRATAAPVSLFPFLAVLMCTMGALIVLLVLVSAQVRDDAVAKAEKVREEEKPKPVAAEPTEPESPVYEFVELPPLEPLAESPRLSPLPDLPDLDAIKRRLATLRADEKELKLQLAKRDSRLLELQAKAETIAKATADATVERGKLEEEIRKLTAARNSSIQELANLTGERKRLLASIADSRKMIQDRQKELKGNAEFQVVSFDGKRGTTRRPIIIECTDKSIEFVSEGIRLSPRQVLGYEPTSNPLLAGANAIVQYWATTHEEPATAPMPYVLLVVRPSGTVGFYLARKFLAELGADHGYELIEEDMEYAAPPADPRATEMARAAIAEMLTIGPPKRSSANTFSESLASGSSNNATDRGPGGRSGSVAGTSGGNNPGQPQESRSFDSREFRRGSRNASSGFFASRNFRNRPQGIPGGGFSQNGFPENRLMTRSGSPLGSGPKSATPLSQPSRPTSQEPGSESGSPDTEPGRLLPAPQLESAAGSNPKATSVQPSTKPFEFSQGQTPLVAGPTGNRNVQSSLPQFEEDISIGEGNGKSADGGDANSASGDPRTEVVGPTARSDANDGQRGEGANEGKPTDSPFDAATQTASPAGVQEPGGTNPDGAASSRASSSAAKSIDATTHPLLKHLQPSRQSLSGETGGGLPLGSPDTNLTIKPNTASAPRLSPRSTQRQTRGHRRQWGIRNPSGTIALERPVIVRVSREEVVIGDRYKITRTVDRSGKQIVEWTLLAMDRVAREWGVPPNRFYWVPAVTLVIEDGGELLRGPLSDQLRKSGVSVETHFGQGSILREAAKPAVSRSSQ